MDVDRPSLFHVIYRFVSREFATVDADVTATPEQSDGLEQSSTVSFVTTFDPMFVTVSGTPFVLDPGRWTFTLTILENVFVVGIRACMKSNSFIGKTNVIFNNIALIAQAVSALDFNFERAVEGSILTAGKKVESENLNVIMRAINQLV